MLATACRSVQDLSEHHTRLLRRNNGNGNGKSSVNSNAVSLQVEDKFDGERVQIHYSTDRPAASFSRNLKATVAWKLDALRDALPLAFPGVKSAIIDGEMLVVNRDTGEQLPFGTLAVHKFAALPPSASVCVLAFDLLYLDGMSLLSKPLSERRTMLEKVLKRVPHRLEVAPARIVKDWGSVEVRWPFHGSVSRNRCLS